MVAAIGARQLDLFRRGGGADHGGAQMFRPLAGDLAHPARGGMEHDGLALFDPEGAAQKILRGHALQHAGGRHFIADIGGQLDQLFGGHIVGFGVGADGAGAIADAIARLVAGDALAHRFHDTGGFRPQTRRHGQRIKSAAMVDINEIDADGGVMHAHLAGAGRGQVKILVFQDFGAAGFFDAYGFHGNPQERFRKDFAGRKWRCGYWPGPPSPCRNACRPPARRHASSGDSGG